MAGVACKGNQLKSKIKCTEILTITAVVIVVVELHCLVGILVTPGTHGQGTSTQKNKSHKCSCEQDSNTQPEGLQHSALTTMPSECPNIYNWFSSVFKQSAMYLDSCI